jgi:hypothetical protein
MNMMRGVPEPEGPGIGFKIWFAFCALLGLGMTGVVVWLIIAAIHWLGRH